jgi:hypothetical protein
VAEGKIDAVIAALRIHAAANDEARKCLDYVTRAPRSAAVASWPPPSSYVKIRGSTPMTA